MKKLLKKGIAWEYMIKLIIGLMLLLMLGYIVWRSKGKMGELVEKLKDLF